MCGIAGIFFRDRGARADVRLVRRMTDRLVHRGPDDGGVVGLGATALGHRRLSILDPSSAGHQPMSTTDRRYWITYNGEIYNFLEIAAALKKDGVRFRTKTDTEVLLRLYEHEGERCLERLNGMFALAIYDRVAHTLFLARDRLGKKPLYLWDDGRRLLFASELKAFHADPGFSPEISLSGLADFLSMLYIPDPRTIFEGVERLPPAHGMMVTSDRTRTWRYWQVPLRRLDEWGEEERPGLERAVDRTHELLSDAVRIRMISDVPLGAFLSGGVDSSLVVGEMCRAAGAQVKTSTIGFSSVDEDESPYAEAVAALFGCDHHTELVEADAAALLETLVWHFDEPFGDSSALPTYLLSKVTRGRVTVALSGDGGDEAFAGYEKYAIERRERCMRSLLPMCFWRLAAGWAEAVTGRCAGPWARGANVLRTLSEDPASAYFRTQSFVTPAALHRLLAPEVVRRLDGNEARAVIRDAYLEARGTDPLSAVQAVDLATSLPGDMLTKVDRMSMAHGLEVRCPLLDHRLVELAFALPPAFRLYRGEGKRVLKRVLARHLPSSLIDRPKHGFTIPMDAWFRGLLAPMVEEVVLRGGLRTSGLLDMGAVEQLFRDHRSRRADVGLELWLVSVLGIWYDRVRRRPEVRVVAGAAPTRDDPAVCGR